MNRRSNESFKELRERDPLSIDQKEYVASFLSSKLLGVQGCRKYEINQARSLGAGDSAHDVFFIQSTTRNRSGHWLIYACKRFRRLESANQELLALNLASEKGFSTVQPLKEGIFTVNDDIGHILVTSHIPRLTTMNRLGWSDKFVGDKDYEYLLADPLKRIGTFVSMMHSSGIVHGDLQLKNLGQDILGNFVLFDMEDARFFDTDDVDQSTLIGYAGEDLRTLLLSLVDKGYLWNSTEETFTTEIYNNLIDPYLTNPAICEPLRDDRLLEVIDRSMQDSLVARQIQHNTFSSKISTHA